MRVRRPAAEGEQRTGGDGAVAVDLDAANDCAGVENAAALELAADDDDAARRRSLPALVTPPVKVVALGVQVLDGVGAGIFGALAPLVIADLMRGTGRYNLALGAIATVQGIGASLSGLAAGEIVDHFGYSPAFLTLGAAALVAVIVFFLQMPETAEPETTEQETVLPKS